MHNNFSEMTIDKLLSYEEAVKIVFDEDVKISLSDSCRKRIIDSHSFLESFSKDKVIYGINTGFGPMAQWQIDDAHLKELQYNIIRSHSSGAGEPLDKVFVRAAILSRLMTFVQGYSGVNIELADLLVAFLNKGIYPMIPQHGSVGASGDLVQLAHLSLALIGEGEVYHDGQWMPASEALKTNGLKPLSMYVREGLAVCNGTAVMTGIGLVNLVYARKLLDWSIRASVLMNEIASSYDDFMSETLNSLKLHNGQRKVARSMREISKDSTALRNREEELYHRQDDKVFRHKVQPYYSLRCIPQILGAVMDEIDNAEKVIINELNSVDDNPVIDMHRKTVIHGGNFHGDYISFEMDKLKIAVTKLTMLTERQMNYLFHDRINGILPPFVNLGVLGLNYGLQAAQFTATSTTAECQTLSNPMYVHSIPNNNDNQDIVSMGTNSALICNKIVENSFQVMAIHLMALAQAVDCLEISQKLSSQTRKIYDDIRYIVPLFKKDSPKYLEIRNLIRYLKN